MLKRSLECFLVQGRHYISTYLSLPTEEQDNTFKRNANQELVNRLGLKSKNEIPERLSGPLSHILITLNK